MTIKKEPDDNIYCHQAPGYSAKIVKTIPYSIHIEKNNQEQYSDHPENLKSYNINRKQINPEKPDVPLNKNDAFQKVQKRRVQEKR